jgi:hypothetical protein
MKPKDSAALVFKILGIVPTKAQYHDVNALMELIYARNTAEKRETRVIDQPNDIKPEENTINLQEVDHFEFPKEFNLQVEGEEHLKKIKIFPDGISESPSTN